MRSYRSLSSRCFLYSTPFRFNLLIDLDSKADIFIAMPRKTPSRPVLTVIFFVLIGVAFFMLWNSQLRLDPQVEKHMDHEAVQETVSIYPLEPVVVELAGRYLMVTNKEEADRPRIGVRKKYLRVGVDLLIKDENMSDDIKKNLPRIRAAVSEIISTKNAKEMETSEGKTALQVEITDRLNTILQKEVINKVFFGDFVIH